MDFRRTCALVGLLVILAVTGCNSSDSTQEANGALPSEPPAQNDKLAILFYRGETAFDGAIQDGIASAAEQYEVEVEFMAADPNDVTEQVTLLDKAIAERFRAICIYPLGSEVVKSLDAANEAGIPVVVFGGDLSGQVTVVSHAGTDQFHAGRVVAEFLVDKIDEDAKVLLVDCRSDSDSASRRGGFTYAAEKEIEKFQIVNIECGDNTVDAIAAGLAEHEDAAAIVAFNTHSSQAALAAAGKDDGTDILVCAYGAWDGAQEAIRQGELTATMLEDPYMIGYSAVMAMADHLSGRDVGEYITTGEHVISKENLSDPDAKRLFEINRTLNDEP